MSIESLKQQARKHEQNEDWKKALDQYNKALAELAREEQVDIGLYNRVGDLYVRVGGLDKAVEHYEKAVELYREAYLPNNAIAVCKKIIRNVPDRHSPYLVMGQIRAEQGFLPDARTQFLTYAERMQQAGDLDESFRALVEFCDLAPDDVGVRITVAEQMAAKGRTEDAVKQYLRAHRHYSEIGDSEAAAGLEAKIHELDPEADVNALPSMGGFGGSSVGSDGEVMADFGEISLGGDGFGAGAFTSHHAEVDESPVSEAMEEAAGASAEEEDVEVDAGLAGFDISVPSPQSDDAVDSEDEEEVTELPMMGFDDDDGEDISFELPTLSADDSVAATASEEDDEGDAFELPTMDFGDDDGEHVELPTMDFDAVTDDASDALSDASAALENAVEDAAGELADTFVTPSFDADDLPPVEEEARADEPISFAPLTTPEVEPSPPDTPAPPPAPPAAPSPPAPPVAPPVAAAPEPPAAPAEPADGGYIDLGKMILGDTEEKSTRFTVAYEEPSGDEEADFAKMLSQFKDKVSENLDSSDVRAHYDLGTAYKEMGLLDEAISSFQAALRASADHLPTYEMMGQTFIEMGQPEAAVRSLERAVESADTVEDELVGIYYYLGRAYEALENRPSAVEYYDRVFSLDINFADVTERLRELR